MYDFVGGAGDADKAPEQIEGKLTVKQEAFAQAYVETGNATEAYKRVYDIDPNALPKTWNEEACRIANTPKVAARVKKLQEMNRKRLEVTVESLTLDFRDAIEFAREQAKPSAVVTALQGLMKLHGLGVERKEVTIKDDLRGMSKAELEAYEKDIEAQLVKLGETMRQGAALN